MRSTSLAKVVLTGTGSALLLAPVLSGQAITEHTVSVRSVPTATVRSVEAPQAAFAEPTLHYGDHGAAVEQMQRRLTQVGYDPGKIDGRWGDATSFAVWAFQKVNQPLRPASHGCVRVPMGTSNIVARLLPIGTRVYVRG